MPASNKLPTDKKDRKERPIALGCLDYFPLAIAEIAHVSHVGNEQHNPGEPLHWSRGKSDDHEDCLVRHLLERGSLDTDGLRHTAKMAWRALAMLQLELEGSTPKTPVKPLPIVDRTVEYRWSDLGQVLADCPNRFFYREGNWYCRTPTETHSTLGDNCEYLIVRGEMVPA